MLLAYKFPIKIYVHTNPDKCETCSQHMEFPIKIRISLPRKLQSFDFSTIFMG